MSILAVPDRFVPSFAMLGALPQEEYSTLRDSLARAHPTLSSSALAQSLSIGSDREAEEVENLIDGLTGLLAVGRTHDLPLHDAAIQVASADQFDQTDIDESVLSRRIAELLNCRPIQLLSKALDVGSEHERIFLDARIVTDLRPIFGNDVDALPEAALLRHSLKLEFIHEEDRLGIFYVVLDEEDLDRLEAIIRRAKRKSTSLSSALERAGLTHFGLED